MGAQAGHAHDEEFVQVGPGYGEKPETLEDRVALVHRLFEHPLIERQPGELPVDEPLPRPRPDCGHISFGGVCHVSAPCVRRDVAPEDDTLILPRCPSDVLGIVNQIVDRW